MSTVVQEIIHSGPISRASIAKQSGLSKQVVSEITRQLERDGWIRETGRTSGHVGRTAITYEIVPDAACIACVDLGGTKVRTAIADLSCNILAECAEPTDKRGGKHVARQIHRLCNQALQDNSIDASKVRLVVVGVPGVPEEESGRVIKAPNIKGLDGLDFRGFLSKLFEVEVVMENDVNLAALGEHWYGNGKDSDIVFISLGTGVGAGIIVDDNLVRGAVNAAGELGYLPMGSDPHSVKSRSVGALESLVGSKGIVKRYKQVTGKRARVPDIFKAHLAGEEDATYVLEYIAELLAQMMAAVVAVVNPGQIVLGGSIGTRTELADMIKRQCERYIVTPVPVTVSSLGDHATLVGAAAVGLESLHSTLFAAKDLGGECVLPAPSLPKLMRVAR